MSSPHMSFRLNYYQLAKALRILITLEPNQPIASLSQMAKIIIIDWISKHSMNTSLEVSQADVEAVKMIASIPIERIDPYTTIQKIMSQSMQQAQQQVPAQQLKQSMQRSAQQMQQDIEDEKLLQKLKRESAEAQAIKDNLTNNQIETLIAEQSKTLPKPSQFHDPNITESSISSVTDFSPPKDWMDSLD